jgi:hypothetical protein
VEVNREIPIHLLRTLLGSSLRDAKFESVMNLHQFLSLLEAAESFLGRTFDDLDSLRTIREGNTMLPSSSNFEQRSAMYGRILPLAALRMFRYALNLSEDDRFVDVGHGLGLVPIQASYMFGCNSCGIYKYESMSLGPSCDCVSWSHGGSCTEPVILHIYERVGEVHPTFMCCECDCSVSRDGMVLNALKHVDSLTHFETCCRTFPRWLHTRHPVDHMIPNLSL